MKNKRVSKKYRLPVRDIRASVGACFLPVRLVSQDLIILSSSYRK
jgi:hypothetical protein